MAQIRAVAPKEKNVYASLTRKQMIAFFIIVSGNLAGRYYIYNSVASPTLLQFCEDNKLIREVIKRVMSVQECFILFCKMKKKIT
jgi:hypothetical protein